MHRFSRSLTVANAALNSQCEREDKDVLAGELFTCDGGFVGQHGAGEGGADSMEYGGRRDGHFYELILPSSPANSYTWAEANNAASNMVFGGTRLPRDRHFSGRERFPVLHIREPDNARLCSRRGTKGRPGLDWLDRRGTYRRLAMGDGRTLLVLKLDAPGTQFFRHRVLRALLEEGWAGGN